MRRIMETDYCPTPIGQERSEIVQELRPRRDIGGCTPKPKGTGVDLFYNQTDSGTLRIHA